MSRCVYYSGDGDYGFVSEITDSRDNFEIFEIYERHLMKPLRGQSIKQMECTDDGCFLLTTEMSQVFFIGISDPYELKNVVSPNTGQYIRNGRRGKINHLVALDSCCISLIGTGVECTFYYSQTLNQMWFTGANLIDNSPKVPNLTQVELPIELQGKEIVKMNGTTHSMLFLTADGLLFALGQFSSTPKTLSRLVIPGIMDELNFRVCVTDVQSGRDHTLVLLSNGECYGIGSARFGQLASRCFRGTREKLTLCNIPGKVTWIRACLLHSFFGSDDGYVYSCGANLKYRLALHSSRDFVTTARPLNFPKGQVKHVFGCHDSMIVDKLNTLYITGDSMGDIDSSLAKKISIITKPTDLIQQVTSGKFLIDWVSSYYCKFLILKPDRRNNGCIAKKLWLAHRNQHLSDIDIITHDDE